MSGKKDPELFLSLCACMPLVLMVCAAPSGDLVIGLGKFPWGYRLAAITLLLGYPARVERDH